MFKKIYIYIMALIRNKKEKEKETEVIQDKIRLSYEIENTDLTKEEIEYILDTISSSKIEGKNINFVFKLLLKLQYKLNKLVSN